MPTYDYECRSCHHRFERVQPMTAKRATACPKCKRPAQRLISAGSGIIFKGSGFYITDHRSSSYKKGAESESKSKPSAASVEKKKT